jgi:hypothetical protein
MLGASLTGPGRIALRAFHALDRQGWRMSVLARIVIALASIFATVGFLFSGQLLWAAVFFLLAAYLAIV